jgi:hypothetical protein
MELVIVSLGGSLVALCLHLWEIVTGIGQYMHGPERNSGAAADAETVIPGF